jgi:lysophospholipase L1-like esterase
MSDRHLSHVRRSVARSIRFVVSSSKLKPLLTWCLLVLGANGVLLVVAIALWLQEAQLPSNSISYASVTEPHTAPTATSTPVEVVNPNKLAQLGERHQLTYQEWLTLLTQEAQAMAAKSPPRLTILLGDSLSLWFPHHLLPEDQIWLNQAISGEISAGLLERLDIIEPTQPDTIFIMIGINDLLRGIDNETILANQQLIIRRLQAAHPDAQIVVQSILPHAAEQIAWEGRDRLLAIPNAQIQALNQSLEAIAIEENIYYLDLYSLFSDAQGNLRPELTTDGLHLNEQGYLVWRSALMLYSQLKLSD